MYSGYLSEAIITNERRGTAKELLQLLHRKGLTDISHIAVRGISGMLMGAELASLIDAELIVVRKRVTKHSSFKVEFYGTVHNYIILDDLIDKGNTIKTIQKRIKQTAKSELGPELKSSRLLAVVCYHKDWCDNPIIICDVPVYQL